MPLIARVLEGPEIFAALSNDKGKLSCGANTFFLNAGMGPLFPLSTLSTKSETCRASAWPSHFGSFLTVMS